jgi:hypothetical protein
MRDNRFLLYCPWKENFEMLLNSIRTKNKLFINSQWCWKFLIRAALLYCLILRDHFYMWVIESPPFYRDLQHWISKPGYDFSNKFLFTENCLMFISYTRMRWFLGEKKKVKKKYITRLRELVERSNLTILLCSLPLCGSYQKGWGSIKAIVKKVTSYFM